MKKYVKLFDEYSKLNENEKVDFDQYTIEVKEPTELPDGVYDGNMVGYTVTIQKEEYTTNIGFKNIKRNPIAVKCRVENGEMKCRRKPEKEYPKTEESLLDKIAPGFKKNFEEKLNKFKQENE